MERELDEFYEAHKHEWEIRPGDLVVIVSESGQFRDHCIYLGPGEDCYHRWWDLARARVKTTPWKQAEIVSRVDWKGSISEGSL